MAILTKDRQQLLFHLLTLQVLFFRMNPKAKWEFYVAKLQKAESQTRQAINDYRKFKTKFITFRYENGLSENQRETFSIPPVQLIDKIYTAQARTSFCKLKIEFYKILQLEGETIANKQRLTEIDIECGKLMKKHGNDLV